ncbi:heavy metal-responsive transcriptional regulator [Kordiimonas gwangyangensis]|uniref:heavy metal-responsive transcriptional regulator n=1 Tax=Kordiimonas gwangyangensis TaxID=288022 RepID=UPI0003646FAB|nr:heavy metal-responsive transcriptional regulator [Kordiimonas gwangyangensis]
MKAMTIGKLSKATGVGTETIRYYERNGFLPAPERLPSGYRVYSSDAAKRLKFIKEAQALGFTLSEISELFALTDDPETDCADVNARASAKLAEINEKIERLTLMRESLERLSRYCPADEHPISECSIINHLYGKSGFDA